MLNEFNGKLKQSILHQFFFFLLVFYTKSIQCNLQGIIIIPWINYFRYFHSLHAWNPFIQNYNWLLLNFKLVNYSRFCEKNRLEQESNKLFPILRKAVVQSGNSYRYIALCKNFAKIWATKKSRVLFLHLGIIHLNSYYISWKSGNLYL